MKPFGLHISAFSVSWLRSYDFNLEEDALHYSLEKLKDHPLVQSVNLISRADEVDEIDRELFDIRFRERSDLVRICLRPSRLISLQAGNSRRVNRHLRVDLLLDIASSFGVFNICFSHPFTHATDSFTTEEIGILTRQWLLPDGERLLFRIADLGRASFHYIREVMNYYFIRLHQTLCEVSKPGTWPAPKDWEAACMESNSVGCEYLHLLYDRKLIRSGLPTSFGPVLDIWKIEGIEPSSFVADQFCSDYESDIAWLFTDGYSRHLGQNVMPLRNERQVASQALYVWSNHAIYINQDPTSLAVERVKHRVHDYGCLDVEVLRMLEVLNLQSALMRTFDSILEQHLANVSTVTNYSQRDIIELARQHRAISRAMRSFDFFNLFHTARWEPLFGRLQESPRLNLRSATELIETKLRHLDDEIRQAVIIQDRIRQQQEREQELRIWRGIHGLSLANDIQNNALMIINFIVSATAAFGLTEVVQPLLTRIFDAKPTFSEMYPVYWVLFNLGVFAIIVVFLSIFSTALMGSRRRGLELEGPLNEPYDPQKLQQYLTSDTGPEYFEINENKGSGYLRIRESTNVLTLEFDGEKIYRFILFIQGSKTRSLNELKQRVIAQEIEKLRKIISK